METNTPNPRIPFDAFLKQYGRTRATGNRWRRLLPWLDITNIFGRLYISVASVKRFEEMAARGELAVDIRPPKPSGRKSSAKVKNPLGGRPRKNPLKSKT
jgi:hypothetical protein